jgi:mRNA interferase RelE/StbE
LAYKLSYKSSVSKDLKHLQKDETRRILSGIEERILLNPLSGKPLKGDFRGCYRYRFGDYRVIYSVINEEVIILRIGNRKDVYK